jgi:hypothetical protein
MKDFNISFSINNLISTIIAKIFSVNSHSLLIATRILLGVHQSVNKLELLKQAEQLIRLEINELEQLRLTPDCRALKQPMSPQLCTEPFPLAAIAGFITPNIQSLGWQESTDLTSFEPIPFLTDPSKRNLKTGNQHNRYS